MEIRNFVTLSKVAEQHSFSKAAELLGYAQSTVSTHIADLEAHYNRPIFDRLGKKVSLTPFGSELLEASRQVVKLYDDLLASAPDSLEFRGTIKLGAPESLMMYRLYPIIRTFKKTFPQIELIVKSDLCPKLRQMTMEGELDLCVLLQPLLNYQTLTVEVLKQEPFCLIAPKGTQPPILPDESQMVLFTEKECTYREIFTTYLMKHKLHVTNTLETGSVEAIKKYVSDGLGISLVPKYALSREISDCSLEVQPIDSELQFYTQTVYHRQRTQTAALQYLIRLISEDSKNW